MLQCNGQRHVFDPGAVRCACGAFDVALRGQLDDSCKGNTAAEVLAWDRGWREARAQQSDLAAYDATAVGNAREQLRTHQRILWAIVDDATRAGIPVRVSGAALAAYDRSSKLLIEDSDVTKDELVLWTDSQRRSG